MEYKCLHIITRLANGGAEETLLDLIMELASKGIFCDIAVGSESVPEVLQKYTLPQECLIHTIPHMVRNPRPIYEIKAVREIRSLIHTYQYNIVQTHGSKAGILGRIAAHKEHVPAIIGTIHGIAFPPAMNIIPRILYKNLERYTATLSDALVCVGEDMKQKYIASNIGKESQYSVIYTGMRLDVFSHAKNASDKVRIACREKFSLPKDLNIPVLASIGRLEDRKNQIALIKMLPKILKTQLVHLCLIGDGPNDNMLMHYAKELGVEKNITFTGYLLEVWDIFPAIDIHCMVSLWEGLPRVLVQTSAAGIPNVCYEVDGAWEIVKDAISGFIIDHGDSIAFIEKLNILIQNKQTRKNFGMAAADIADERWSLTRFGADTVDLYKKLLS